jgi:hypothetical protein
VRDATYLLQAWSFATDEYVLRRGVRWIDSPVRETWQKGGVVTATWPADVHLELAVLDVEGVSRRSDEPGGRDGDRIVFHAVPPGRWTLTAIGDAGPTVGTVRATAIARAGDEVALVFSPAQPEPKPDR